MTDSNPEEAVTKQLKDATKRRGRDGNQNLEDWYDATNLEKKLNLHLNHGIWHF